MPWYPELGKNICPGCDQDVTDSDCDCDDYCDGRLIEAVCVYASTCDWCAQLTAHKTMWMHEPSQLGYCEECTPKAKAHHEAKDTDHG